jgi:hypothetical protein
VPVLSWLLGAGRRPVAPSPRWKKTGERERAPRGRTTRPPPPPEASGERGSQLPPSAGGSDSGPGFLETRWVRDAQRGGGRDAGSACGRVTRVAPRRAPRAQRPADAPPAPRNGSPPVPATDSPSPGTAPRPLRAAARPAQPSEPILLPKVRIQVADFPYPHSSSH